MRIGLCVLFVLAACDGPYRSPQKTPDPPLVEQCRQLCTDAGAGFIFRSHCRRYHRSRPRDQVFKACPSGECRCIKGPIEFNLEAEND